MTVVMSRIVVNHLEEQDTNVRERERERETDRKSLGKNEKKMDRKVDACVFKVVSTDVCYHFFNKMISLSWDLCFKAV